VQLVDGETDADDNIPMDDAEAENRWIDVEIDAGGVSDTEMSGVKEQMGSIWEGIWPAQHHFIGDESGSEDGSGSEHGEEESNSDDLDYCLLAVDLLARFRM
jgi:hypothetical protein